MAPDLGGSSGRNDFVNLLKGPVFYIFSWAPVFLTNLAALLSGLMRERACLWLIHSRASLLWGSLRKSQVTSERSLFEHLPCTDTGIF